MNQIKIEATKPDWLDESLGRLMRGRQQLPVHTAERSQAEQHGRLLLIIAGFVVVLAAALNGLLFGVGVRMAMAEILQITLGVPLGLAVLLYLFFYFVFVRGRRDDGDHPWTFFADARGMSLERANGARIGAPWSRWRYEGYFYGMVKTQRFVKGLDLSLDGEAIRIDLTRVRKNHYLARAILQGLARAQAR